MTHIGQTTVMNMSIGIEYCKYTKLIYTECKLKDDF